MIPSETSRLIYQQAALRSFLRSDHIAQSFIEHTPNYKTEDLEQLYFASAAIKSKKMLIEFIKITTKQLFTALRDKLPVFKYLNPDNISTDLTDDELMLLINETANAMPYGTLQKNNSSIAFLVAKNIIFNMIGVNSTATLNALLKPYISSSKNESSEPKLSSTVQEPFSSLPVITSEQSNTPLTVAPLTTPASSETEISSTTFLTLNDNENDLTTSLKSDTNNTSVTNAPQLPSTISASQQSKSSESSIHSSTQSDIQIDLNSGDSSHCALRTPENHINLKFESLSDPSTTLDNTTTIPEVTLSNSSVPSSDPAVQNMTYSTVSKNFDEMTDPYMGNEDSNYDYYTRNLIENNDFPLKNNNSDYNISNDVNTSYLYDDNDNEDRNDSVKEQNIYNNNFIEDDIMSHKDSFFPQLDDQYVNTTISHDSDDEKPPKKSRKKATKRKNPVREDIPYTYGNDWKISSRSKGVSKNMSSITSKNINDNYFIPNDVFPPIENDDDDDDVDNETIPGIKSFNQQSSDMKSEISSRHLLKFDDLITNLKDDESNAMNLAKPTFINSKLSFANIDT